MRSFHMTMMPRSRAHGTRCFSTRGPAFAKRSLTWTRKLPLIQIKNGTFFRHHPSSPEDADSKALFRHLDLSIPAFSSPPQHWAVLSPSSIVRSLFLRILRGHLICLPYTARSYPYLKTDEIATKNPRLRFPETAIEYVGFHDDNKKALGGAYLSARYESRVEETDFTVEQYFTGITEMNVSEAFRKERTPDLEIMMQVAKDLELVKLFKKPVSTLSNGQSRRARIGKALLRKPEMLLLDAPFIGLDPRTTENISGLLERLSNAHAPRIFVSLRPQDFVPDWITHVVFAEDERSTPFTGSKKEYLGFRQSTSEEFSRKSVDVRNAESVAKREPVSERIATAPSSEPLVNVRSTPSKSTDGFPPNDPKDTGSKALERAIVVAKDVGEPIVEMDGVNIKYGTNSVLGDWTQIIAGESKQGLHWAMKRGQRWGIFGANGSGKTTLLSLITSDHPQTYSAPVRLFGRSRLPSPGQLGISIFDIQARTGHASPEVHALFPGTLSVRRALESAFGDTPLTKPKLDVNANARVDACLRWFASELNPHFQDDSFAAIQNDTLQWAQNTIFRDLSFSSQRVLLFLRAIIRSPDIVILDEAFSGMDVFARSKCFMFLSHGESIALGEDAKYNKERTKRDSVMNGLSREQALLCVSHSQHDVPGCVREWICLPEPGTGPPRVGRLNGPVEVDKRRWDEIWGIDR